MFSPDLLLLRYGSSRVTLLIYLLNGLVLISVAALDKSQGLVKSARLAIHNAVLVPTLLYGIKTWVCKKKHESKLNAVEMRSLRKMCGVAMAERKRNEEIRNMAGLKDDLITKIEYNTSLLSRT